MDKHTVLITLNRTNCTIAVNVFVHYNQEQDEVEYEAQDPLTGISSKVHMTLHHALRDLAEQLDARITV